MSETLARRPRDADYGCSDHGCVFGHPGGMGTNGGCKCLPYRPLDQRIKIRRGITALRADLARVSEERDRLLGVLEQCMDVLDMWGPASGSNFRAPYVAAWRAGHDAIARARQQGATTGAREVIQCAKVWPSRDGTKDRHCQLQAGHDGPHDASPRGLPTGRGDGTEGA